MANTNIGRKARNEQALSRSTDSYVDTFQHLQGHPHADKALLLLQKVASLVKPIMRSHGWHLPLLSEFFPENPGLLGMNVNGGQQILLRLRPHSAPNTFYDDEFIISTMLHELTHNVHGPHDQKFYAYLATLEKEYDELQRSGYAGEGFFAPGQRLGQGVSHDLPPHVAKQRALEAAERRAKAAGLSGVNRLGGKAWTTKGLIKSPRELTAEAAERRARDEKACAHDGASAEVEAAKAARDGSRNQATDLPVVRHDDVIVIDSDSDSDIEIFPVKTETQSAPNGGLSKPGEGSAAKRRKIADSNTNAVASGSRLPPARTRAEILQTRPQSKARNPSSSSPSESEWPCPACTFVNHPDLPTCEICLTERPKRPPIATKSAATLTPASIPPGTGSRTTSAAPQTRTSTLGSASSRAKVPAAPTVDLDAWDCAMCGEREMDGNFWTCRFCGSVKLSS